MSRLEDIRARLDAATPWAMLGTGKNPADADLITHAPKDLRDLLAVAEAARDHLDAQDTATAEQTDYALRAAIARLDGDAS